MGYYRHMDDKWHDISLWWTPLVLLGYVALFVGLLATSMAGALAIGYAGMLIYRWVENPGFTTGFWVVVGAWLAISVTAYAYERYQAS